MKLTDTEKREILKLIEADKPRKSKPLMDANTRESGKSIRGHSRLLSIPFNGRFWTQELYKVGLSEAKPSNLIGHDKENNAISQTCLCDARRQVTSERCNILLYSKGKQGIWQRRFREHQIRNEIDFTKHVEYIHFNPVKHGLVKSPVEWPYSSFPRQVKQGAYDSDWGAGTEFKFDVKVGHE